MCVQITGKEYLIDFGQYHTRVLVLREEEKEGGDLVLVACQISILHQQAMYGEAQHVYQAI